MSSEIDMINFWNRLIKVDPDDLYDHLFQIYVEHKPTELQHLGYVDKSSNLLEVTLPNANIDLSVQQSLSLLSSGTESSTTGFICWQGGVNFADWVLADPRCPIRDLFNSSTTVLELGAGVGAVLASVLGPRVSTYVASDQKHLLKLMKANFANNVVSQRYQSSTLPVAQNGGPKRREEEAWSSIDFIEFDWEFYDKGRANYLELTSKQYPDVILASDTIYNTHLIPHFVNSMKSMMDHHTISLVTLQLRDEDVTEQFLLEVTQLGLELYAVRDEDLDQKLMEGFMVYCIKKEKQKKQFPC